MAALHRVMRSKDADGMANSLDVDQQSDLGLHCLPRPVCPKTFTVVTVGPSILSPDTYFIFFFPGDNTCTLLCHS